MNKSFFVFVKNTEKNSEKIKNGNKKEIKSEFILIIIFYQLWLYLINIYKLIYWYKSYLKYDQFYVENK